MFIGHLYFLFCEDDKSLRVIVKHKTQLLFTTKWSFYEYHPDQIENIVSSPEALFVPLLTFQELLPIFYQIVCS